MESANLRNCSDEELNAILESVNAELKYRKESKNQKLIENFCHAMAELVLNVPTATMIYDVDVDEPEVDCLSALLPCDYRSYSADELADFIKRNIQII